MSKELTDALELTAVDYRAHNRMAASDFLIVTMPWHVIETHGGWQKVCEAMARGTIKGLETLHPSGSWWTFRIGERE